MAPKKTKVKAHTKTVKVNKKIKVKPKSYTKTVKVNKKIKVKSYKRKT